MSISEERWLSLFAFKLLSFMNDYRMSQKELAEISGLSESTISRYTNKTKMPSVKAVLKLSYALGIDVDELIDFGDPIE